MAIFCTVTVTFDYQIIITPTMNASGLWCQISRHLLEGLLWTGWTRGHNDLDQALPRAHVHENASTLWLLVCISEADHRGQGTTTLQQGCGDKIWFSQSRWLRSVLCPAGAVCIWLNHVETGKDISLTVATKSGTVIASTAEFFVPRFRSNRVNIKCAWIRGKTPS